MDVRITWRLLSRNFPRPMGLSGIILCLVVGSTVLLEGCGMQESEEVALLRATAEQGDAEAQFNLGLKYDRGEGIAQDYAEAARWYRMAAEQGDVDAQFNLGLMYFDGQGVAQDLAEAYAWIGTAAALGQGGTVEVLQTLREEMTPSQIERAEELAREYREKYVTR